MGGEERLLRRVLGLGPVAEQRPAEPRDEASVRGVQLLGRRNGRPALGGAVSAGGLGGAGQSPSPLPPLSSSPESFESSPWLFWSSSDTVSVTVWPTSEVGSVRPAGSGTVSVCVPTVRGTGPPPTAETGADTCSVVAFGWP